MSEQTAVYEPYEYKNYGELRAKLLSLVDRYPNMLRRESADETFGINHRLDCGDERCIVDIITMTNFKVRATKK
jgi:predicted deacylase